MSFLAPAFLGFLGLLPIVVLLYILKLRRTEVIISSTMLWFRSLHDLTANTFFQRLRRNLLLFLQLLAILLLALALARPYVRAEGARGENLCVILDCSASMQTVEDDGRTRLDIAKERALELIEDMESDESMMIATFGQSADVRCELTTDRRRLRRAVNAAEAADTKGNIRDVMLMAQSLAPDNPDIAAAVHGLELILISDGRISDLERLGGLSMKVGYIQIGKTKNNVGMVAFSVRKQVAEETAETASNRRQAFLLVHNEADWAVNTTLTLYADADAIAVEELALEPMEDKELVFELPEIERGVLRAELDIEDAFLADNKAWLALRPEAYLKVLLVGAPDDPGVYFLKRVLSLDPRVELSSAAPADFADNGEADLILFNGWTPEMLPAGTLCFFNAIPAIAGLGTEGDIENPPILGVERSHPVMRFLNPGNVRVAKASKLALPAGARTLMSTTEGALIADVSIGGQHILVAGFDLAQTNWPLNLSFPLFIQNLLAWTARPGLTGATALATGEPIELVPGGDATSVTVETPDGRKDTVNLDPLRAVYYAGTSRVGAYTVTRGDAGETYAVNLLDRNESSITPADNLALGRGEVAATAGPLQFNREFWRWIAATVLAILAIEWWVYSRRAYL